MSNYNETDRMIYLSQLESEPSETSHLSPLTTIFYPDDQISTYQQSMASTTPMPPDKRLLNGTFLTTLLMERSIKSTPTVVTWYPSNHKRQYSSVYRNRGNDFVNVAITQSSTAKRMESSPQKRMFFPDDDFDYVDSYQNVNSIQDILNQNGNEHENVSDEEFMVPSMPFSRTMKVQGIYRREKKKRDHLTTMETVQNGQITAAYDKNSVHDTQKFDQFLKFKPSSPSEVNMLASNIMKLKQYSHHKPRPLTSNKYHEEYYGSQDPNLIYQQIISAGNKNSVRNGRYEKPPKSNKPFSLMLDVYPMPEDETQATSSSTRTTPYSPYRRPIYPVNAVNHNLQYSKENAFYNHLKFPQLQPYPYNRPPYVMTHSPKDGLMRQYATQRMNTNIYRPVVKSTQTFTHDLPNDEAPSQITVHLNLYPDRKKYQTRNVEILSLDATPPSSVQVAKNNISVWKRFEQYENATTTKMDSIDVQPSQHPKPYIPPFSAIKINTLQQSFDSNDTESLQQSTDKSIEYQLMQFDSKKLVPTIKLTNLSPTTNSIVSTSSPYFNDIESTVSTDLTESIAPTTFSQFGTTMSSSTYNTPINHFSVVNTNTPFETTATTDTLNESKLDQPTTINTVFHFPNH